MEQDEPALDVAIIGGGLAGVIALHYARRAGLRALVFERQGGVGGLWRELPAWQDIQISASDWQLGDLPMAGTFQPHILANIESWVDRFGLADGIRLNSPASRVRQEQECWAFETPQGTVRALHLIAATGVHNVPVIPPVKREASTVRELHSSALREPGEVAGRDVVVVGGGASAYDLLDLCLAHGARTINWVYRGLRWFTPTGKPKHVAGSVRGFARLQASGINVAQQNDAIRADMLARYAKFGLQEITPDAPFDVLHDQLIPGRHRMLANFGTIRRLRGCVESIAGRTITVRGGERVDADLLLWGTGYAVDLSYFESPAIAAIRDGRTLAARCGGLVRSLDAQNLYFPGVGLDGIGAAPWAYALVCRTIMSHIRGQAQLDTATVPHKVNHFALVDYLAARDPASYPAGQWQAHYRSLALETPDDQPYPIP